MEPVSVGNVSPGYRSGGEQAATVGARLKLAVGPARTLQVIVTGTDLGRRGSLPVLALVGTDFLRRGFRFTWDGPGRSWALAHSSDKPCS